MTRLACLFTVLVLAAAPLRADKTVFAAASLRGPLEFMFSHREDVTLVYGGSGAMARQVAAGAPADLVVLAHVDWMDWLVQQGRVAAADTAIVAHNALVLIGPADAAPFETFDAATLMAALGDGRLATGQRDAVPAGQYARQWLTHIGAWATVENQLAETDNVAAALALVATGAAPLGVVYASDAPDDPRVTMLWEISKESHDPIEYVAAPLSPEGRALLKRMMFPSGADIFVKFGFNQP